MCFSKSKWESVLAALWLNFLTTTGFFCPAGFILNDATGTCWFLESAAKTWYEARDACELKNSKLGIFSGQSDFDFVYNHWGQTSSLIWTGVNDLKILGVHKDVDDNDIPWTNWSGPEEDNTNDERCVLMRRSQNGKWNDYPCMQNAPSVCMSAQAINKIYHLLEEGTGVRRDEIGTHENVVPQACPVLCSSTPTCMSFARNGSSCKLLKYSNSVRSFVGWDLFD